MFNKDSMHWACLCYNLSETKDENTFRDTLHKALQTGFTGMTEQEAIDVMTLIKSRIAMPLELFTIFTEEVAQNSRLDVSVLSSKVAENDNTEDVSELAYRYNFNVLSFKLTNNFS